MTTPEQKAKWKRMNSKPAAIARRIAYRNDPEIKERIRQFRQTPEGKEVFRDRDRKKHYGLERGEWQKIFDKQDRKCEICKSSEHHGRHWHTDHCHKTKKVRGILCHHCNHLLGSARDLILNLQSAIRYLRKNG